MRLWTVKGWLRACKYELLESTQTRHTAVDHYQTTNPKVKRYCMVTIVHHTAELLAEDVRLRMLDAKSG